jgi:Acyl carrier protein
MLELLQNIIFDVTGKKGVNLDTDFIQDLELNSFDIMNIICAFEESFNVVIPTRDVWQIRTVADAVNYLHKRGVAAI